METSILVWGFSTNGGVLVGLSRYKKSLFTIEISLRLSESSHDILFYHLYFFVVLVGIYCKLLVFRLKIDKLHYLNF